MSDSHNTKLAEIDVRLQLINEERLALLNERQALITQHEAELAQNFNLHASPESKIDLFLSYFKGRNDQGNRIKIFVALLVSSHYPSLPFAA